MGDAYWVRCSYTRIGEAVLREHVGGWVVIIEVWIPGERSVFDHRRYSTL